MTDALLVVSRRDTSPLAAENKKKKLSRKSWFAECGDEKEGRGRQKNKAEFRSQHLSVRKAYWTSR